MANSTALTAMWRSSSPLAARFLMAAKICDGAARNRAFATTSRLRISHSRSPATIEMVPARYLRAPRHVPPGALAAAVGSSSLEALMRSVDDLRRARQKQAVDRKIRRNVADLAQRIDNLAEFL